MRKGLAIMAETTNLQVTKTKFQNLTGDEGAAIYFMKSKQDPNVFQMKVEGCIFWGIQSRNGGAVYSLNSVTSINMSTFVSNYAVEAGGSLYVTCGQHQSAKGKIVFNNVTDCSLELRRNLFAGNVAGVKGGALYYE